VNSPNAGSELIAGLPEDAFPGISGLVLSSRKESPLVEVPLVSPNPKGQFNPLLAHWTYGLGRAVAFTSDAGRKWTTAWPSWDGYASFWWQVVRWALRPVDDRDLSLSLKRDGDRIKVVVDAIDKEERSVNFLQFQGMAVSPELDETGARRKLPITMVQTAPGRYEGSLDQAATRGSYFISLGYVGPDGKTGLVSGGVSVPYSEEYRELHSNAAALESLASATGGKVHAWSYQGERGSAGSASGATTETRRIDMNRTMAGVDAFRRDPSIPRPMSLRPLWPTLLYWSCLLFLADVAVRRLAPDVQRWARTISDAWKTMRGEPALPREEYIEKLQNRKAEVDQELERARSGARFGAPSVPGTAGADRPVDSDLPIGKRGRKSAELTPGVSPNAAPASKQPASGASPDATRGEKSKPQPAPSASNDYTDRLLKAKQKVWENRRKSDDQPNP